MVTLIVPEKPLLAVAAIVNGPLLVVCATSSALGEVEREKLGDGEGAEPPPPQPTTTKKRR